MTEITSGSGWTSLDNGWIRAKVPLPFSLRWVNGYLLPDEDGAGWTVIDPGLRTDDTIHYWEETLEANGIAWHAIRRIVLTHHHPDHYGLAGWFQEKSGGAPVYLSQEALDAANRLWGEGETFSDELTEALLVNGLPSELEEDMRQHLASFRQKVAPQPQDVRLIQPGEELRMGGTSWTMIRGDGHGPGHISFYDEAGRRIICGDQVLPDITPNIGWMPGADPDPLTSFLDSISAMKSLDVGMAYPGHRDPYPEFAKRIEQLLEHHERRLARMSELIGEAGGATAFELCELLFGARLRGNAHNLRFALAETIAHLIVLEKRGLVRRTEQSGIVRYLA